MKRWLVLALCAVALPAVAQTARVIPLSAEDSQEARAKWEALQAAQKTWDDFQNKVAKKYTEVHVGDPDAGFTMAEVGMASFGSLSISADGLVSFSDYCEGTTERAKNKKYCDDLDAQQKKARENERMFRKGFEWGFEFDKDFHFIVPKPEPASLRPNFWPGTGK